MNAEPRLKTLAEEAGMSLHAMMMAELAVLGDAGGVEPAHGHAAGDAGEVESQSGPHHVYYDRKKGWMLRVTVDLGGKVIGKRLKFRLRTRDAQEAEKARDLVLATLKRLGLTVRLRMQGRQRSEVGAGRGNRG